MPLGLSINLCFRPADQVCDGMRECLVENLGEPGGVLVADETRMLKNGDLSAGVQRQYSGTAGLTIRSHAGRKRIGFQYLH